MATNTIDDVYGSRLGVDFAKAIAESLLKSSGQPHKVDAEAMKGPAGILAYTGPLLDAIRGAGYRNIAGSQDKVLADRRVEPFSPSILKSGYGPIQQPAETRAQQQQQRTNYQGKMRLGGPNQSAFEGQNTEVVPEDKSSRADFLSPGSGFFQKVEKIESGGNPNLINKLGYAGLYQFNRELRQKYGLNASNWNNPEAQREAALKYFPEIRDQVAKYLGREPTEGELYLAHQQGVGGASNHLNNPFEPAWKNMARTAEGRRKGEAWAKRAIVGNLPNGSAIKAKALRDIDSVTSSEFASHWTSKFDGDRGNIVTSSITPDQDEKAIVADAAGAKSPTTGTLTDANPDVMNVGDRYAQAFPNQGSQGLPGRPNQEQYKGPFPPIPPIMSDEQLKANLRDASPENRDVIMQKYLESRKSTPYDLPGGAKVYGTPTPDGQGQYTTMPGATQTISIKGANIPVIARPDGSFGLMLPGVDGGKNFSSLSELFAYVRQEERLDTASQGRATGDVARLKEAQDVGKKSSELVKVIDELDALSKTGNVPRGPTSRYSILIRQVLDNFGMTKHIPKIGEADLGKAEVMQKINAELAREAVNTFTNRGTNFELQTYMDNNPGISQSKEGMEMLLDIMRQDAKSREAIGKLASEIPDGDINKFNERIAQYYKDNPIIITGQINDPRDPTKIITKKGKIWTGKVQTRDDVMKIPRGHYFMNPQGGLELRR